MDKRRAGKWSDEDPHKYPVDQGGTTSEKQQHGPNPLPRTVEEIKGNPGPGSYTPQENAIRNHLAEAVRRHSPAKSPGCRILQEIAQTPEWQNAPKHKQAWSKETPSRMGGCPWSLRKVREKTTMSPEQACLNHTLESMQHFHQLKVQELEQQVVEQEKRHKMESNAMKRKLEVEKQAKVDVMNNLSDSKAVVMAKKQKKDAEKAKNDSSKAQKKVTKKKVRFLMTSSFLGFPIRWYSHSHCLLLFMVEMAKKSTPNPEIEEDPDDIVEIHDFTPNADAEGKFYVQVTEVRNKKERKTWIEAEYVYDFCEACVQGGDEKENFLMSYFADKKMPSELASTIAKKGNVPTQTLQRDGEKRCSKGPGDDEEKSRSKTTEDSGGSGSNPRSLSATVASCGLDHDNLVNYKEVQCDFYFRGVGRFSHTTCRGCEKYFATEANKNRKDYEKKGNIQLPKQRGGKTCYTCMNFEKGSSACGSMFCNPCFIQKLDAQSGRRSARARRGLA